MASCDTSAIRTLVAATSILTSVSVFSPLMCLSNSSRHQAPINNLQKIAELFGISNLRDGFAQETRQWFKFASFLIQ